MASSQRRSTDPVDELQRLVDMAPRSRFFAIVALLERLTADAPRVGSDVAPAHERLRFRHDPSLAFSASDVSEATVREGREDASHPEASKRRIVELTTTFLGLTGSSSPMPLHIAEEVSLEDQAESHKRDFLDIFHHRLVSLFYRLWTRYDYAREYTSDGRDPWSPRVLALGGSDRYRDAATETGSGASDAYGLRRSDLLRILPLFVARSRGARALQVALDTLFGAELDGATVQVEQFAGRWVPVDSDQHTRLGRRNHGLGRSVMLGSHAYDRAGRFVIHIGPVRRATAVRLRTGGDLEPRIRELVDVFLRAPREYGLEIHLDPREHAGFRLSSVQPAGLGRETWLSHAAPEEEAAGAFAGHQPPHGAVAHDTPRSA